MSHSLRLLRICLLYFSYNLSYYASTEGCFSKYWDAAAEVELEFECELLKGRASCWRTADCKETCWVQRIMTHGIISRSKTWKSTAQEVITLVEIMWFSMGILWDEKLNAWHMNIESLTGVVELISEIENFGASQAWKSYNLVWIQVGYPCLPQAYGSAMERVVRKQWTQCLVLCSCVRCAQLRTVTTVTTPNAWVFEGVCPMAFTFSEWLFAKHWGLLANDYLTFSDPSSKSNRRKKTKWKQMYGGFHNVSHVIRSEWDNLT